MGDPDSGTPPAPPSGSADTVPAEESGVLGPAAPVRCLRCGTRASNEPARPRAEAVSYFCNACTTLVLDRPILPPGYDVVRELGRGGMGAVYLAVHTSLGVRRALKVILPRAALSEKVRRLFVREASEQAKLVHPRIVQVHDLLEVKPGIFCIVMEYVEGENASALLERTPGGLEVRAAVSLVAQALEGLGHAHARGVVHRDVKDANLLVGRGPGAELSVKLADFGLAKSFANSGASGFTRTGEQAGTLNYMAPEQLLDFREARPAADLYSMGVTLYRLLSGAYPLDLSAGTGAVAAVLEQPAAPLRSRSPGVSPKLAAVVERCLEKDPGRRFGSAEELREAILQA